jgi:hypothetical protein
MFGGKYDGGTVSESAMRSVIGNGSGGGTAVAAFASQINGTSPCREPFVVSYCAGGVSEPQRQGVHLGQQYTFGPRLPVQLHGVRQWICVVSGRNVCHRRAASSNVVAGQGAFQVQEPGASVLHTS